ncbi:translesion DNA synthesis-associated protein ImuA [Methylibium sp.]|uniref:translesion DNA synthesis-associated protein ImuA n=1 Tax=Methylibium sp. TaxID=2067992 RepID=UPI0017EC65F6|nr:translesion DNA synthesis-associated protein ImuA [Methylibium sp.]MBA3589060.1 translesion DNA synthesis-associated protein ImuA [Methylibium sp.]
MAAVLEWAGDDEAPALPPRSRPMLAPGELPPAVASALWRGTELGSPVTAVLSSGFAALDAELPGAGWPCHSLTEVLQAQASVAEWRLLAPAMRRVVATGRDIVVVGPPKAPHLPGLQYVGLDERRLVWVQTETPAERLWVTEQLIKANAAGLLVAWLPQARPEQIRRLQVCAQTCDGPVFLCRPASAEHEASAAPLRVQLRFGIDWELHLHILKRKGPVHEGIVTLPSVPGGLESIITPRLRKPSVLIARRNAREVPDVVGRTAPRPTPLRRATAH